MAVKSQSSVQLFDKRKAESTQAMRYRHQRKLSSLQVNLLTDAMNDGSFSPVNTIMFAQVDNDNACINGQHTMEAIIRSNKFYELPVVQYLCDTEQERSQLYYRIDRQRRRVISDSVRSLDLPQKTGLTPTQIKISVAALRHIKGNWGVNRNAFSLLSDDRVLAMLPFWVNDISGVYSSITPCSNGERGLILKKAVFSVALVTAHYAPAKAFEFWRQVAQDDGLERYDPRKTIRTWLWERARNRNDFSGGVIENEVSRAVALAWNAYCEERTLRYTLVRDATKPMVLLGTPYNGAQDKDFLPEWSAFSFEQDRVAIVNQP